MKTPSANGNSPEHILSERLVTADSLIAEIYAAFPSKRDPGIGSLSDGGLREEPMATEREFADKTDWTQLDYDWLDQAPDGWGTARSFFSPAAACFYLPAYLMADIHFKMQSHEGPVFNLTLGFGPSDQKWRVRTEAQWAGLSCEQVQAVVHYLEWAAQWNEFDREQIEPALAEYWYPRLSA